MFSHASAGKKPLRSHLHDIAMVGQGAKSTAMKVITLLVTKYLQNLEDNHNNSFKALSIKQKIRDKELMVEQLAPQIEKAIDYSAYQKANRKNKELFRDTLATSILEKIQTSTQEGPITFNTKTFVREKPEVEFFQRQTSVSLNIEFVGMDFTNEIVAAAVKAGIPARASISHQP